MLLDGIPPPLFAFLDQLAALIKISRLYVFSYSLTVSVGMMFGDLETTL